MDKYESLVLKYYALYVILVVLERLTFRMKHVLNFKTFSVQMGQLLNWIFIITGVILINSTFKTKKRINLIAFGLIAIILGIMKMIKNNAKGNRPTDWSGAIQYIGFALISVVLYPITLSLILHKLEH